MKDYKKWFRKAENDLLSIKNNLSSEDIPVDVCCFHAQQCVEKYLKAYLVAQNIVFPKTPDLKYLLTACIKTNNSFLDIELPVFSLVTYAITPRYPDEIDELIITDAKEAYNNALLIKDFILKHFFE
jgi:HEPN domain-containing protein